MNSIQLLQHLKNANLLHALLVDIKLLSNESGWSAYASREPGCVEGFAKAFAYILEHKGQPLTIEFIQEIHALLTSNVSALNKSTRPGMFRDTPIVIQLGGYAIPDESFQYLKSTFLTITSDASKTPVESSAHHDEVSDDHARSIMSITVVDTPSYRLREDLYYAPCDSSTIAINVENAMRQIISCYNENKPDIDAPLIEQLRFIVSIIKTFELLHPFSDANNRTFINTLLNWMLREFNLPFAMMYEPNIFDYFDVDGCIISLIDGMVRFCRAATTGSIELEGYHGEPETDAMSALITKIDELACTLPPLSESERGEIIELQIKLDQLSSFAHDHPYHIAAARGTLKNILVHELETSSCSREEQHARLTTKAPVVVDPLYATKTPFLIAILCGHTEIVKYLMETGIADVNEVDSCSSYTSDRYLIGPTALHIAAKLGRPDIVNLLLSDPTIKITSTKKYSSYHTPIEFAAKYGHIDVLKICLASKKFTPDQIRHAFFEAAVRNHSVLVDFFLDHAEIDLKPEDVTQATCLAAEYNAPTTLVRLLQDRRANINDTSYRNNTALMYAAQNGQCEIIEYLLKQPDTETNHQNHSRETALHNAVQSRNAKTVALLLSDPRVDTTLVNRDGMTARDLTEILLKADCENASEYAAIIEVFDSLSPRMALR